MIIQRFYFSNENKFWHPVVRSNDRPISTQESEAAAEQPQGPDPGGGGQQPGPHASGLIRQIRDAAAVPRLASECCNPDLIYFTN